MANALVIDMRPHLDSLRAVTLAGTTAAAPDWRLDRQAWVEVCALRLSTLLPGFGSTRCDGLAADLWQDLSTYDPLIAAEMEFESGILDH